MITRARGYYVTVITLALIRSPDRTVQTNNLGAGPKSQRHNRVVIEEVGIIYLRQQPVFRTFSVFIASNWLAVDVYSLARCIPRRLRIVVYQSKYTERQRQNNRLSGHTISSKDMRTARKNFDNCFPLSFLENCLSMSEEENNTGQET